MRRSTTAFFLSASILASIGGAAAFLWLFLPDFNIYWLILSPIIFAFYQTPAVLIYRFYKRRKAREEEQGETETENS